MSVKCQYWSGTFYLDYQQALCLNETEYSSSCPGLFGISLKILRKVELCSKTTVQETVKPIKSSYPHSFSQSTNNQNTPSNQNI